MINQKQNIRINQDDSSSDQDNLEYQIIDKNNQLQLKQYTKKDPNSQIYQNIQDQFLIDNLQEKQNRRKVKQLIQQIKIKNQVKMNPQLISVIKTLLLIFIILVTLFRVILEIQVQTKNKQKQQYYLKSLPSTNSKFQQFLFQQKVSQSLSSQNKTNIINPALIIPEYTLKLTQQCKKSINKIQLQKGKNYIFNYPTYQMKKKVQINNIPINIAYNITKQQYFQAIDLLELNHRASQNLIINFQGLNQCQSQKDRQFRLFRAMNQQKSRLNKLYSIDQYFTKQLRFCIVVNSFNNVNNGLIYRNLDSILQQNYTNFHVVYTDDNSKDKTIEVIQKYLQNHKIFSQKFLLKKNQNKVGMMENIYNAITYNCNQGQIAVLLDGDDSFVGINVLSLLNAVYQKEKLAVIWSQFISIHSNQLVSLGFSRGYPQKWKQLNNIRFLKFWISSHLKTFFVDIFRKIKKQDLQHQNLTFYGGASDTATMFPVLQLGNPKFKYLPQILYEYRYDTGQLGNIVNMKPQQQALNKLYKSKPYKSLKDFSFIQKAIQNALDIRQKSQN